MKPDETTGYRIVTKWMKDQNIEPFDFQTEAWQRISEGYSGLINAPTGYGKTFSVFMAALMRFINENPGYQTRTNNGLQLLWITPLRALAKDIGRAMETVIEQTGLQWKVGIRNGDTPLKTRQEQRKNLPEILIITPESLHLLLALKGYPDMFSKLQIIAVDEWHELVGSKRGVQVELAISRIAGLRHKAENLLPLQLWGISATIGNLNEAADVLLSSIKRLIPGTQTTSVIAKVTKKVSIHPVYPSEIETYPWAGHLGLKLIDKVIPIIQQSRTTLLFINTRGMSETWYHALLSACPELAGAIALHHGSIEFELRNWVEENLHSGNLKVVVCTSSLDLGVDFRPVETVIQVGSPKAVSRFLQRAGRSGHSPFETSKVYFVPTHSLELAELAALREAHRLNIIESRPPLFLCFDVLLQYLVTLAVSEGFDADETFEEIRSTFCFNNITRDEYNQCLSIIHNGGAALTEYDEYQKTIIIDGKYHVVNRKIAMRHRMHIGTIVSDPMMKVKLISGSYVGAIEEYFISRLNPGDVFTLAGRRLEFVMVREMTAIVRKSNSSKTIVPSWRGGRMPLSSDLGTLLRLQIARAYKKNNNSPEEIKKLSPLFSLQEYLSHIPSQDEILMEHIETDDGFHLFVYPFEGRLVHEAMAALIAWRLSQIKPITFSLAMNDYGFELLSDQPIPLNDENVYALFSPDNLTQDIRSSLNSTEMAKRKFREIAVIGGLVFQGFPTGKKKARHLQASTGLLFDVFSEYDLHNLLLRQAYHEAMEQQMEEARLRRLIDRIQTSKVVITYPRRLTPFCFPIKVDSMRENLTSEKLEDRIRKMTGGK